MFSEIMVTSSVVERDSLNPDPDQDPGVCHFDDKKFKNFTIENKFNFFFMSIDATFLF
jgi:hypothetical protein